MPIRITMCFRLFSLVAFVQLVLLLCLALPTLAQTASETLEEREKAEAAAAKIKEEEERNRIKAEIALEKYRLKAAENAEKAKLERERELAKWYKDHPRPASPPPPPPSPTPPSPSPSSGVPNVNGVAMFPGSIFNADISNMPVDPNSANWLAHISGGGAKGAILYRTYGPCFTNSTTNGKSLISGYPINVVGPSQAEVPFIATEYASECDPGPVPMPGNAAVEGSVCPGGPVSVSIGDVHSILLQTGTTGKPNLWEFYSWNSTGNFTYKNADGSWGGFMASWNTNSNAERPNGWTSTNAGGLPMLPLLVRYDEVVAGAINHALYFSINWVTNNSCIWPSTHTISSFTNDPTNYPPMGAWLRLKDDYDISGFNPACQVVLNALKHHGGVVMDVNGGGNLCTLQGDFNQNWTPYGGSTPPGDMSQLGQVTMDNFDYIDVSSLMVSPTSYQAATSATSSVTGGSPGNLSGNGSGTSGIQIESHHSKSSPRKN